eukprot:ctg_210.g158
MIKFLLMMSRHGKLRLAKWFDSYTERERQKILRDVATLVLSREPSWSNRVDYPGLPEGIGNGSGSGRLANTPSVVSLGAAPRARLVYKRYASLFIIACLDGACADAGMNELLAMDTIHQYVETLDRYFGNVCELDLIFNFPNAYYILDDMLTAGEFAESSREVVLRSVEASDRMAGQERDDKPRA